MTVSEPVTVLTDYLLAVAAAWFAWRLRRGPRPRRLWGLAFAALAAGALLGGTWHGFVQSNLLWKATVLALGVASFAMVAGSSLAVLRGAWRFAALALAAAKLAVYGFWMLGHDGYIYVVLDSGLALLVVAALHLWRRDGWMLAGVAVSVAAALVQASGLSLHAHFNHNDLYHVVQLGALFLLYRGAARLSDAATPTPAPPPA